MAWTKISKFSKRNGKRRSYRKSTKKTKRISKGMRKAIVKVVRREEETKVSTWSGISYIGAYGANTSIQNQGFIPLTPYGTYVQIPQGTGQGERTGNQIRLVKVTFDYVVSATNYAATANPIPQPQELLIRLFSVKNTNALVQSAGNYFQNGNASANPVGTLVDITRPVNNDLYTQYRFIRHKIGYAAWVPTPGLAPANGYYANNDFALNVVKKIDVTKYCPKLIRFNDNTTNATTRILQTFIECVNSDGSSAISASVTPLVMTWTITISYKDA